MKQKEMYIFLDRVKFYSRHGVGEQETVVGGIFVLSLRLQVDFWRATESDELEYTVSYADVYAVVKQEMDIPSKLLEHVSGRIIKSLFSHFPAISKIELKLSKQNPPMGADLDGAGVIINCDR